MRFLSLFSGIESASVAWGPLGWECVAVAEIEPFPCSLLRERFPNVPNLGDVRLITQQMVESLGHIDVVVGGFPCQDLSVAGPRKGLDDDGKATRSGLFYDLARIADWSKARWVVAENVPGLFSSKQGRDFAAVVGALAGCRIDPPAKRWENTGVCFGPKGLVEWSVLDAQWFGLAQRRKRVFLVRDSGDWANRPPVLLESASMSGDSPPSREAGENVAGTIASRSTGGGGLGTDFDLAGGLQVVGTIPASDGGVSSGMHPVISMCLNGGGHGKDR